MNKLHSILLIFVVALIVFFFSEGIFTSINEEEKTTEIFKEVQLESVQKKRLIPKKRSVRKGPTKPPKSVSSPSLDKKVEENRPEKTDFSKRKEYFDNLDSLENPNVSEQIMLGEMAFDANENEAAYEHYLDVIENHSDDPMAPFALYKFAWVQFNLGDTESAIADMKMVNEWLETGEVHLGEMLRTAVPDDLLFFQKKKDVQSGSLD